MKTHFARYPIAGLVAAGMVALTAPAALAQAATATATGDASARVVTGIELDPVANTSLDFGRFTVGTASGGTISVSRAGVASVTTTVVRLPGDVDVQEFLITGEPLFFVNVTGDATVTLSGPAASTMDAVLDFLSTGQILSSGLLRIFVGGTLTVGAAQAAGTYDGVFDITVAYQ